VHSNVGLALGNIPDWKNITMPSVESPFVDLASLQTDGSALIRSAKLLKETNENLKRAAEQLAMQRRYRDLVTQKVDDQNAELKEVTAKLSKVIRILYNVSHLLSSNMKIMLICSPPTSTSKNLLSYGVGLRLWHRPKRCCCARFPI
jgi:hypothetical protein